MEHNTDAAGWHGNGVENNDREEETVGTIHAPAWTRVVTIHALAWTRVGMIDALAWTRVGTIHALAWTRLRIGVVYFLFSICTDMYSSQ